MFSVYPEVVLRNYLKPLFKSVRGQFPDIHLQMRDGDQASLEELLRKRVIHVATTIFDH